MMKKLALATLFCSMLFAQSCATIFGGPVTQSQRVGPGRGGEHRKIRWVALILDLPTIIGLPIDLIDCAIYKPAGGYRGGGGYVEGRHHSFYIFWHRSGYHHHSHGERRSHSGGHHSGGHSHIRHSSHGGGHGHSLNAEE